MEKLTIDGVEVTRWRERSDRDGGMVIVTLIPAGNGEYFAHREWRGHGIRHLGGVQFMPSESERTVAQNEARAFYGAMTQSDIRRRVALAREQNEVQGEPLPVRLRS